MESAETRHWEKRWPVVLTIFFVQFLLVNLHERIRLFPVWVTYVAATVEILPLIAVELTHGGRSWLKVEQIVTTLFAATVSLINIVNLSNIVNLMVNRSSDITGLEMFTSAIGVWSINLLSFSLVYWLIDRGGPGARVNNTGNIPDWLFPQESAPHEDYPVGWKPAFIDYLFLGFCTATAFSPTDTLPLTHRAKVLVMLESSISLLAIVVVLSRAVNILASS